MTQAPIPFHTFLLKTASRCNINCSYCYVYNQADDGWKMQPKLMSEETAALVVRRIRDHLDAHGKTDCSIVLHGGEPLLGGRKHLEMLIDTLLCGLVDGGIDVTMGIQSNGLLFTREIGELCRRHGITLGVSIDGPPEVNDRHRVDHRNRPTSMRLEPRLRRLATEYPDIFGGILCVIDPTSDPEAVFNYLLSFAPRSIDFLFPLNNHDNRPPQSLFAESPAPFGDWLVRIYDAWMKHSGDTTIRLFRSIMNMWLGLPTLVESIGLLPVDLVVVETNGEIEGVDSLKATYRGATKLGFNVAEHGFDEVARHTAVLARQSGALQLCDTCRSCRIVEVCGGGYIPHRYSAVTGFANPSVYCRDLTRIIDHIGGSVRGAVARAGSAMTVATA
jgi:uncharacterized protein